jgi:hypothetical protein
VLLHEDFLSAGGERMVVSGHHRVEKVDGGGRIGVTKVIGENVEGTVSIALVLLVGQTLITH